MQSWVDDCDYRFFLLHSEYHLFSALVVKLADTTDLGSVAVRCGGSSPPEGISLFIVYEEKSKKWYTLGDMESFVSM